MVRAELEWAFPAVMLTFGLAAFVLVYLPDWSGIAVASGFLPLWIVAAAGTTAIYLFVFVVTMMVRGEPAPIAKILTYVRLNWRRLALTAAFIVLAGLNMAAFMWAKPLLNYVVPFTADPLLANIDSALFLGTDPWKLLTPLNSEVMALFYHRGWFALMIFALLTALLQPPSSDKSAALLTYFVLWSVVGPVIHVLLPAGGPIFYAPLGYGDRFAAIPSPDSVELVSSYLWGLYSSRGFGPGAGISAMPSLHIATTVWAVLVIYKFARRWTLVVIPVAILIFLLSISLGWHYAVDGIVGGVLCGGIWVGIAALLRRSQRAVAARQPLSSLTDVGSERL